MLHLHARGGLGEVYLAEDAGLGRQVALKEIQAERAADPANRERFVREAEVTGRLEHPGIVPVYDLGFHADGRPFYAMRFIQGLSLAAAIQRFHRGGGPANAPELRLLLGRFVAVCNAVAYAHSKNVLHRDLKPANVMLGDFGETLLVDWGLARALDQAEPELTDGATLTWTGSNPGLTRPGAVIGTPAYMSPEQAGGQPDLGLASDVYGLGATLFCLLTGKPPIDVANTPEALRRAERGDFPPPRRVQPAVPKTLEAICLKAMALRPQDRYASARALAEDVEHWLADEPISAYREPLPKRAGRWVRRHKALVTGLAAALLVATAAAVAGGFWYQQDQAERERAAIEQAQEQERQELAARVARAEKRARVEAQLVAVLGQAERERTELQKKLQEQGGVFRLLNNPADWQVQLQKPAAVVAAARQQADGAGVDLDPGLVRRLVALQAQLQGDEADRQLAVDLNQVRQQKAALARGSGHSFGFQKSARRYEALFRKAGLVPTPGQEAAVVARISRAPIREQLVAALDDWAVSLTGDAEHSRTHAALLAAAQAADPDPWAKRFRDASLWGDPAALMKHVTAAPLGRLSPALLYTISVVLEKGGPRAAAVAFLRNAQALHPTDFLLTLQTGQLLSRDRQYSESAGYLRTAVALQPDNPLAHGSLAAVLANAGHLADARAILDRELKKQPDDVYLLTERANVLIRLQDTAGAEKAARRATELDPLNEDGYRALGYALLLRNQKTAALTALERAVQLNDRSPMNLMYLGLYHMKYGKMQDAADLYRRGLKLAPEDPLLCSVLGATLFRLNQTDEGVMWMQKAARLHPREGSYHVVMAEGLLKAGRFADARAAARKGLELLSASTQPLSSVLPLQQLARVVIAESDRRLAALKPVPVVDEAAAAAGIKGTLTKDDPFDTFPPTQKSHRRVHAVKLSAGKTYQIDLTGEFDTFLRVEDSAGKLLLYNDDVTPPKVLDSRLIFTPPADGTYRLVVASFTPAATGQYLLKLLPTMPFGKPMELAKELTDKSNKVQGRFEARHKVELTGGRPHTLVIESTKFDPLVLLIDPTGKQGLVQRPEPGTPRGRRVQLDITPPQTGTYTVVIATADLGQTGPYTLRVQAFGKKMDD